MTVVQDHPDIEKLPLEVDGIPVRETIREIFRNPENGTPDYISKAGCLVLADTSNKVSRPRLGYVVWNAWRSVFPKTDSQSHVDFRGYDFRQKPVNFSGFNFGDYADFQGAFWPDGANFRNAQWGDYANFAGASWLTAADFSFTEWGDFANFVCTKWRGESWFTGARWGGWCDFRSARWKKLVNFTGAQWGDHADFRGAQWEAGVFFSGKSWERMRTSFPRESSYLQAKEGASGQGKSPSEIFDIDFSGATFGGGANFSNRHFKSTTDFGSLVALENRLEVICDDAGKAEFGADGELLYILSDVQHRNSTFAVAPIFHGCELHQDTSFEGAKFPSPSGSEEAARAYRTLKLAFSKQQAIREEQRFFRLEMEEETLRETGLKRWLFKMYKWASDYGFSILRPLFIFLLSVIFFAWICQASAGLMLCFDLFDDACKATPLQYSFAQALPLPGFDKLSLFKKFEAVNVGWLFLHKTISLAALFLIGLALRNLFKLK
jgi:uncharacterized protein YjbI with pentapeptide repeats